MSASFNCLSVLCVLVPLSTHAVQASTLNKGGLDKVIALVRRESFPEALAVAESQESPLGRAQAELYVLHNAGDLAGALKVGIVGLRAAPRDLWLLERVCYITISLHATDLAREYLARLSSALDATALPADEQAHWRTISREYEAQVESLTVGERERSRAALYARLTVYAGAALSLTLLVVLAVATAPMASHRP